MRKFLLCLVALMMLLTASALAEATVVNTVKLEGGISLCDYSNNYIARTDGGYALFDPNGNRLSDVYKSMMPAEDGKYIKVQNVGTAENINCVGLLDAQGKLILPLQYGSIITYYAEDWVFAHALVKTDSDVGEYSDSKGNKYIIDYTDVVYDGKGTTLDRDNFKGSYRVTDRGPSVFVKISDNEGYWMFYRDGAFQRRDVVSDSYVDTSEYSWGYKKPVFHNPTEWEAFTAGCALTPDQVEQHVWFDENNQRFLDLQGNVLAENLNLYAARYRENYFEIRDASRNYGVMTFDGKTVIPAKYSTVAHNYNGYFRSGYNAVVDESGNLYYYDEAGNITASAEYQMSYSDYKGFNNNAPIVHVKNMGKYMIITATNGTLPENYEDVVTCEEMQKVIVVKKNGLWGVIDMAGNTVVPFEYTYTPDVSDDGTVILCQANYNEYVLYQLSYDEAAPAANNNWTVAVQSGADVNTDPVLAEGAWECTCGVITNGKFCPECGSKKPEPTATPAPAVDDGTWGCTCGSVNTGKFCPECGTAKPVATPVPAEPECAGCGYKPEGAAPKFCPECGTKF